ncbi:MAG: hypothetical protein H7Y03_09235 [Chitinophagaceae bacterium]|nr:hypothetical protein [Chitinophagaceae bacterium]
MQYLLFIIYLLFFCWLISKTTSFKSTGLSVKWLIGLFLVKLAGAVIYGFIYRGFGNTSDTWQIFNYSIEEYNFLLKHPLGYLRRINLELNPFYDQELSDFFGTKGSFWNDLKDQVLIKAEVLFNVFSFGNYYVNCIFYIYLTFGGYIALYKALMMIYPGSQITSLIAAFFIPSTFFWTSGMYKDGVLFMLFGYIIYHLVLLTRARQNGSWVIVLLSIIVIGILRSYLLLILLPCLLSWWLAIKRPALSLVYFGIIVSVCIIGFFCLPIAFPSFNLPQILIERRQEFMALEANTSLPAGELRPGFLSFLHTLPEAFNYGFLRPYLWENKGIIYLPFAIELVVLYSLLVIYAFRKKSNTELQYSFFVFSIFLLACSWFLLGYTAPITGALIRYKSIFPSFLVAHLLHKIIPSVNTYRI